MAFFVTTAPSPLVPAAPNGGSGVDRFCPLDLSAAASRAAFALVWRTCADLTYKRPQIEWRLLSCWSRLETGRQVPLSLSSLGALLPGAFFRAPYREKTQFQCCLSQLPGQRRYRLQLPA